MNAEDKRNSSPWRGDGRSEDFQSFVVRLKLVQPPCRHVPCLSVNEMFEGDGQIGQARQFAKSSTGWSEMKTVPGHWKRGPGELDAL
ncbi:hypothetical protein VTJ49DRAFT_7402 [Mycothermus thermophilus]|uniref:Uncharacterized protein n=1 Tax=Humicola insolens TaxID=85995 RepID=A0ABR3VGZ7_HUMIN